MQRFLVRDPSLDEYEIAVVRSGSLRAGAEVGYFIHVVGKYCFPCPSRPICTMQVCFIRFVPPTLKKITQDEFLLGSLKP
jgi:hypothetical protein